MNDSSKKWFAVYTKPRWEKKINAILQSKGIESWCPLHKIVRQWSDRKKIIEDTLFKSYVFVNVNEEERIQVLQTNGVLNFVFYLGKPAVIKDDEIHLIKSYLQEKDATITTHSWDSLAPDIKVKIQHGVFMDNTGTVLRTSRKKVYVRLESLGQVMVVEFPAAHVTPIQ
ncbi:UpxY family transcription antiterminator [Limnovirga soli]|uniref:UpxY family transcription antiterminator n=1 Tax=Limnovirga soli TaxID=2656915 RepID=A0A8J8FEG3_9BACT|nr:UpxY family transcription antiterminator [Limnovirga soli]NNV56576.1 UpxY family transcription antiterminator [Limnovirga soli]